MDKLCYVCDKPFKNGDDIVAAMRSTYKQIDSDVHYAITTPSECFEIVHLACSDFAGHDIGFRGVN